MSAREDLATWMADLASSLQDVHRGQPTFETIVHTAREVVPGTTAASITVRGRRGRFTTLATTSAVAGEIDGMQYSAGEGPCVETADEDVEFTRAGDIGSDTRWPRWGPAAAELGVTSLLSLPLLAGGDRIGALNLYSDVRGAFSDRETVDLALLYAVHAAHALTAARQVSNLEVAMTSRHTIGLAQGIVMERYALDAHQAFEVLRRISSQTNTKLAVVASEIVDTGLLPDGGVS